jgi:hypothetical protein
MLKSVEYEELRLLHAYVCGGITIIVTIIIFIWWFLMIVVGRGKRNCSLL